MFKSHPNIFRLYLESSHNSVKLVCVCRETDPENFAFFTDLTMALQSNNKLCLSDLTTLHTTSENDFRISVGQTEF